MVRYSNPPTHTRLLSAVLLVLVLLVPDLVLAQDIQPDASTVFPQAIDIVGGEPAAPGEWPWQVHLQAGSGMCE